MKPFTAYIVLISALLSCPARIGSEPTPETRFQTATPGYVYSFPRDHGSHETFRTEWWYYTGHLRAKDGRRFGYELTFFRRGIDHPDVNGSSSRWAIRHLYLAHAALSDHDRGQFHFSEKLSRAGLGKAGAESDRLHVWIDGWTAEAVSPDHREQHLGAATDQLRLDLTLRAEKAPVAHGQAGVSRKGGTGDAASHYYSLTRLATTGAVTVGKVRYPVTGVSWMDHEFGSSDLAEELVGWDWFSVQLSNHTEIMLYLLRREDGRPDPSSSGTIVFPDGTSRHLSPSDFHVETLEHWTSPASGARYPSRWRLTLAAQHMNLELRPLLADQELRTERSTQVTYWEGAVDIQGRIGDTSVDGQGYVELTGYAERFRQKL